MQTSEKYLYHSFPRPRNGKSDHEKALKILESVFRSGLLLTPETYKFSEQLKDGSAGPENIVQQKRVCFTQIHESELSDHATFFGDVSLQFEVNCLQIAHTCPVFYLPQDSTDTVWKGAFGSLLARIGETEELLLRLKNCSDLANDTALSEKNLNFTKSGLSFDSNIKLKDLHNFLTFLQHGAQPFQDQLGALKALSSLFYPVENTTYTEKLGYYMQREWRYISGIKQNDVPLAEDLTDEEKIRLVELDPDFFEKKLYVRTGLVRRVDLCQFLRKIGNKTVAESINKIFVPGSLISHTENLLKKYGLEIELVSTDS